MATRRARLLIAGVATLAGALVVVIAIDLFPYGSVNHDEGVYLQQAELLLDGRLWFETPLPDAFQWWFFVEDGSRLYSKYQPVVPALFAVGLAVGVPRLVLGVVGGIVVGGVVLLTREAYDLPTALAAAALVVASPLFLFTTSVFLPYAPTTALNLVFAYAYVRGIRSGEAGWRTLAGLAVGLAFFARPYTALLFAVPFVAHALWLLWAARRSQSLLTERVRLLAPVAALGTAFVGLTLAYNAVVTGDPLVFPYQAFAPADGIGFGRREILGYERDYTLALALEANARVLWEFATRTVAAPPFGALAVGLGLGLLGRRLIRDGVDTGSEVLPATTVRLLLAGVFCSVIVGNLAFWGNLNILADLADPTDGFISGYGPFYHYDLLLPVGAFGAAGLAWLVRQGRAVVTTRLDAPAAVVLAVVLVLAAAPVVAVAEANAVGPPVAEHAAYTDRYEATYAPFADGSPTGLVFVPAPYGGWLGHPFQSLRNDAGLDGRTVYALDRSPGEDFAVVDAYPDRDLYRFTYRGTWSPEPTGRIVPHIQPLSVQTGERHRVSFQTGVVGRPSTVRVSDGDDSVSYTVTASPGERFTVEWTLVPGRVVVVPDRLRKRGEGQVEFDGSAEIAVAVTYVQSGGATVTYRQEVAVEERGGTVRLVWPPEVEVCRLTPDCGHEGMYVPGGDYVEGAAVNQTVRS